MVQNLFVFLFAVQKYKGQIYRTIFLPFVLYGCDTWSPTVSKENRLRVFGNRVLRKIFGPMRDEVMGSGEDDIMRLYDLYPPNIWVIKSRRMRWVGHTAHMRKRRGSYRILVGRLEGKRPLGRPRHRWWDYIEMDLQEVGWEALTRLFWPMTDGLAVLLNAVMETMG